VRDMSLPYTFLAFLNLSLILLWGVLRLTTPQSGLSPLVDSPLLLNERNHSSLPRLKISAVGTESLCKIRINQNVKLMELVSRLSATFYSQVLTNSIVSL